MNMDSSRSDLVIVQGLEVEALIGVYDWERDILQRVVFDLELQTDIRPAAEQDNVTLTLDYKSICDDIAEFTKQSSFQLIESLAESVAQRLLSRFSVSALTLRLSKPDAIPAARNVAVQIHRASI